MIDINQLRDIIIELYKHESDDYVLTLGHWDGPTDDYPIPSFHGRLQFTLGMFRRNNFGAFSDEK